MQFSPEELDALIAKSLKTLGLKLLQGPNRLAAFRPLEAVDIWIGASNPTNQTLRPQHSIILILLSLLLLSASIWTRIFGSQFLAEKIALKPAEKLAGSVFPDLTLRNNERKPHSSHRNAQLRGLSAEKQNRFRTLTMKRSRRRRWRCTARLQRATAAAGGRRNQFQLQMWTKLDAVKV